jgi:uncharacterized protein (TIGR02453 family)
MSVEPPPFAPALFRFLRELRKSNDRDWFRAHEEAYERDVSGPALRFITAFAGALRRINPHFVADPRPVGGSLYRLQRDERRKTDKRPFKTHVGIVFRHANGRPAQKLGLYLHLEPGDVFAAAGMGQPDHASLCEVRDAMIASPSTWRRAIGARGFPGLWGLAGDSLVRVPRGYDPQHELAVDLKRKSFVAVTGFTEREACAADFPQRLEDTWRASAPLLRFLARALALPW